MSIIRTFEKKRKIQIEKENSEKREITLSRLRFEEACKKFVKKSKELRDEIKKRDI